MKRLIGLTLALGALNAAAIDFSKIPEPTFTVPHVVPQPREMSCDLKTAVRLNDVTFDVTCPDAAAADWVARYAKRWFNASGKVSQSKSAPEGLADPEAYRLSVAPKSVSIEASGIAGVRWAFMTLRQSARRESGGMKTKGYWLAAMKVQDAPTLRHRSMHFTVDFKCPLIEVERKVRLAAYYKCNYVFLDLWGSFASEQHPELSVPGAPVTPAEARRLASVGRDLGVTVIPGVATSGHASSPDGRHVYLDLHPELEPIFENNKAFNWCLTNPDTRALACDFVAEMHEAFLSPEYFHICCDEIDPPDCPTCRTVYKAKLYPAYVGEHIRVLAEMLRARGARAMIWHDMLLDKKNPAWKPCFYANGDAEYEKMAESLPKDIIICDWYYGVGHGKDGKSEPGAYPTIEHFKKLGFDVITCPFDDMKTFMPQANYARAHGLMGYMATTWYLREQKLQDVLVASANAAWTDKATNVNYHDATYYWRQTGWDAGVKEYKDTGFTQKR